MQIVKEKIYMVNKATADKFFNDAVEQGFLVSDNLKYNDRLVEKLNSNHYVPMTFHSNGDFVHTNSKYIKETMEEVLELIKEAKDTSHDIYRFNAGKEIVIYKSKKVLI